MFHSERNKAFSVWSLIPQMCSGVFDSLFSSLCVLMCVILPVVLQVDADGAFPQVLVWLVVSNPQEGRDLSQLCIRDSVSDVTLLQTNGSVQERGFQTFSTDSLRGTNILSGRTIVL